MTRVRAAGHPQCACRLARGGPVGSLLAPAADRLADLTGRERQVLGLMAEGLSNGAVTRRLFLSDRTVEAPVRHLLIKLEIGETDEGHRRVLAVLAHLEASRDASP